MKRDGNDAMAKGDGCQIEHCRCPAAGRVSVIAMVVDCGFIEGPKDFKFRA